MPTAAPPPANVHPLLDAAPGSLTVQEVATLFRVARSTVHAWRRPPGVRGVVLPSFLLAGRRMFRRQDVAHFVDELQAQGLGPVRGPVPAPVRARGLANLATADPPPPAATGDELANFARAKRTAARETPD
jgi:hypothetical protein